MSKVKFHDVTVHDDAPKNWILLYYLIHTQETDEEIRAVIEDHKDIINSPIDNYLISSFVIGHGRLRVARLLDEFGVSWDEKNLFGEAIKYNPEQGSLEIVKYLVNELHLKPQKSDIDLARNARKDEVIKFLSNMSLDEDIHIDNLVTTKIFRASTDTDLEKLTIYLESLPNFIPINHMIKYAKQNEKLENVLTLIQEYMDEDAILRNTIKGAQNNEALKILVDRRIVSIKSSDIAFANESHAPKDVVDFLESIIDKSANENHWSFFSFFNCCIAQDTSDVIEVSKISGVSETDQDFIE